MTVSNCQPPRIDVQPISVDVQPGASVTLSVDATGTAPLDYAWHVVGSPNTVIGVNRTCRITNGCGRVTTQTSTVRVPLPAPTLLQATRASSQAIALTWTAAAGAHHYVVERMRPDRTFDPIGTAHLTSYLDQTVSPGLTYVYRVIAVDANGLSASPASNRDLATMMVFTTVAQGNAVDDAPFHELLTAVNALYTANGWLAATWASILPPGVPVPGGGVSIRAAHLAALRDRMSAARQALGVSSATYADDPLGQSSTLIRAAHVTAVQQRAQ